MEQVGLGRGELAQSGSLPPYSGRKLSQIAFPLGGIGTGSVSLSGAGALIDWEIFNRPNIGSTMPYSFFTLWAQAEGEVPVCKVVQGPPQPPFSGGGPGAYRGLGFGVDRDNGAGLPHFRGCTFYGEYPLARIDFDDPAVPVQVTLEAYNPFIPLNADDSGLPAAIFHFRLHNPGPKPVQVGLAANLYNAVGYPGEGPFNAPSVGGSVNVARARHFPGDGRLRGLFFHSEKHPGDDFRFGTMALATWWPEVDHQTCWFRGAWFDALHKFWDEFSRTGALTDRVYDAPSPDGSPSPDGVGDVGSIVLKATVAPGKTVMLPVAICWHFPNFVKYWGQAAIRLDGKEMRPVWKNYYAAQFVDAWAVAEYVAQNEARLYADTKLFHDTLFASTLPPYVLDAASSQMSTIKSTTCLRLTDGTFYGFEGCHTTSGCCEGSCTHVWNYAQAVAFLFPALERSMRTADYTYNLDPDGHMGFRIQLPLGTPPSTFHAAADGQMGGVLKVYRDWKLCGDDGWLKLIWGQVKRALAYAWTDWDLDRDGVMEGVQHNTYDIEFWGPNTLMGSLYLGALRAAEGMARYLGEDGQAGEYRALYERGRAQMDAELFNGEFYVQKVNPQAYKTSPRRLEESMGGQTPGAPKYQYGEGCLSDQLLGQWLATLTGLEHLFDREHVRQALQSIFRYNWRSDLWDHANPQRIYALNDEQGLLLCTWPRGGRPELPFVYSDEVWCGIEYQVASHLIYEGFVDEGLRIVKGVRDRHDGERRNPWNEFECGSHYARSMASWGLITALSGFEFDAGRGHIGFGPRLNSEDFRCFWSLDEGWGSFAQKRDGQTWTVTLSVAYGEVSLSTLGLGTVQLSSTPRVVLDDRPVSAVWEDGRVVFERPVRVQAGQTLEIKPGSR